MMDVTRGYIHIYINPPRLERAPDNDATPDPKCRARKAWREERKRKAGKEEETVWAAMAKKRMEVCKKS